MAARYIVVPGVPDARSIPQSKAAPPAVAVAAPPLPAGLQAAAQAWRARGRDDELALAESDQFKRGSSLITVGYGNLSVQSLSAVQAPSLRDGRVYIARGTVTDTSGFAILIIPF